MFVSRSPSKGHPKGTPNDWVVGFRGFGLDWVVLGEFRGELAGNLGFWLVVRAGFDRSRI